MKSMLEILDETAAFYNLRNRAVDDTGQCRYYVPASGCMCAVGRCLIDPSKFKDVTEQVGFVWKSQKDLDEALKEEYRGHKSYFWFLIQRLHDNIVFWTESGLSISGQEFVASCKADIQAIIDAELVGQAA